MKKVVLILIALMLTCTASAEVFTVSTGMDDANGCGLLIDEQGTLLTPMYEYGSIYQLDDSLPGIYAAMPYDYTGLIVGDMVQQALRGELEFYEYYRECLLNEKGEKLTGFDYCQFFYDENGGMIIASRPDGGCDVLSAQGELLMYTNYCWIRSNGNGGFLALRAEEGKPFSADPCAMVYVDGLGRERELGINVPRWSCGQVNEGFCFIDVDGENGFYVNASGEEAFGMTFAFGEGFKHGTAIVHNADGMYGLIDRNGQFVLPMVYADITQPYEYDEGPLLAVTQDGTLEIYERESVRLIARYRPEDIGISYAFQTNSGMIQAYDDNGYTALLVDGTPLFRQQYSDSGDGATIWYALEDGTCPQRIIMEGGEWPYRSSSLVDLQGNKIGGEWRVIEGAAWLEDQGRFSVIDYGIVEDEYGPGVDWSSYRYGLVDENGTVIHETIYDSLTVLTLDLCWVQSGDIWGLVDSEGNWLATVSAYSTLMD